MKNNIINKLAALLTVSGLSLTAPLTVTAQFTDNPGVNVTANGASGTASGASYSTTANNFAGNGFYASNSGTIFSGTVNIVTTGTYAYGVQATGTSTIEVNGLTVKSGMAAAVRAASSSTIGLHSGANVRVEANGTDWLYGLLSTGTGSVIHGTAMMIETGIWQSGSFAQSGSISVSGISAERGGFIDLGTDSNITVHGYPVNASGNITNGGYGIVAQYTGFVQGANVTVTTDNAGIYVNTSGTVRLTNSNLTAAQNAIEIYANTHAANGVSFPVAEVTLTGGVVTAEQGDAIKVITSDHSGTGADTTVTISDATVNAPNGNLVDNRGTGDMRVTLNHVDASNAGGIVTSSTWADTTTVTVENGSSISGTIAAADNATLTLTLDNSTLTGVSTLSDNAIINLTLRNGANWNLTGKSKLTTLTSSGGSITIDNVQGEDLTVSSGISGQTSLHLTLSDGVKDQTEIRVVVDETNAMSNSAFTLGSEVSNGMYDYVLENKTDGAWLIYTAPDPVDPIDPNPPVAPIISSEGDAVINTAAAVSAFWFTQLDNLHKRMGELRYNKPADGDVLDNVWVRAYGQQINASTNLSGVKGFSETQYGVDLGTDHLWNLNADNQLYTGIFAGYGGADRQFHSSYNGSTDSGYGGLYATWLNDSGWYADVVAKGQYFRNDFSGADSGKYDSIGAGVSLEFGRQFEFNDGWFAEPSVQVSYLHLMNDNYTTRDGMAVTLSDADVLHFYGGARLGRNIKLTNSGMLQPYIKVGGLEQISSGNKVTVSGDHWRPNLNGARAVVGAGLVWQLDADNQLHLDYEASFGDKYDKPWGLNFGYRHQF